MGAVWAKRGEGGGGLGSEYFSAVGAVRVRTVRA